MGEKTFQSTLLSGLPGNQEEYESRAERCVINAALRKGIVAGLIGGLVATIVMDLVIVRMFPLMGIPADVSFSVIGDTAAGLFSMLGIDIAGGVPLGIAVHYLTGFALGMIFGAIVTYINVLRRISIKKSLWFGILYTEIISLPILATAPLVLKMTVSDAAQWFGVSFIMHLVYGAVLGVVVSYGLWR